MNTLSDRIRKSRSLKFNLTPGISTVEFHTIGSQDNSYWLRIERSTSTDEASSGRVYKHTTYTIDCRTEDWKRAKAIDPDTFSPIVPCQGNSRSVCYHCLGLAIDQAEVHGYKYVGATDNFDHIARLRNLGDCLIEVKSANSGKSVWMILKRVKAIEPVQIENKPEVKSVVSQMSFNERVNAMRGKVEDEVIE